MKNTVDRSELPVVEKDTSGKIIAKGKLIASPILMIGGIRSYLISPACLNYIYRARVLISTEAWRVIDGFIRLTGYLGFPCLVICYVLSWVELVQFRNLNAHNVAGKVTSKIILGRVIATVVLVLLVFGYLVCAISLFIEKSRVAG